MLIIRHCMVLVLFENNLQDSLSLLKIRCLENGMII